MPQPFIARLVDAHGTELTAFCNRWRIRELCVFGSAARGEPRPSSDVDFMADYDPSAEWDLTDHVHMTRELAAIVGRDVDLIDRPAIERSPNRYLRESILASAERVYEA